MRSLLALVLLPLLASLAPGPSQAADSAQPSAKRPALDAIPAQHALITLRSGRTVKVITLEQVPSLVGSVSGVLAAYFSETRDRSQADAERAEVFDYSRLTAESYGQSLLVLAAISPGRSGPEAAAASVHLREGARGWKRVDGPVNLPAWATDGKLRFVGPKPDPAGQEAVARMSRQWLEQMDAGAYEWAWTVAAPEIKARLSLQQWIETWSTARSRLRVVKRSPLSTQVVLPPEGMLTGAVITAEYLTTFQGGLRAVEIVTANVAGDGTWRVVGYILRPQP